MSPRTKRNLMAAMECDAVDAVKYNRFAERARLDNHWELAKTFQETAETDRTEHFAAEAELAGLVAATADNLRHTIDAEMKEARIFIQFAREATEDGDFGAAATFEAISRDKAKRRAKFDAILGNLGLHSNIRTVRLSAK